MKSRVTFTLAALMVVAATTCFANEPANNNAPAMTQTAAVDDWSALDQPVDEQYLKSHSPTHGLQAVVAEVRATLSGLVTQFRALVGRVDRHESQIAELQARIHDLDGKSATDMVAVPSADTVPDKTTETDGNGATNNAERPVAPDSKTTGEQQVAPITPVAPKESMQAGNDADKVAPAQAEADEECAPAQAGAIAPGAGAGNDGSAAKPANANKKTATPKTRLEAVESSVECLNAGQSVLIALIVIMSLVAMIALIRAVRAEKGVINLAKASRLRLGNGKSLAEGGTFPDESDVFKDSLVEAWVKRGGAPLEPTTEGDETPPDEAAEDESIVPPPDSSAGRGA